MRVTWVNPCFLHYRVPVYAELDRLLGGGLSVVFSASRTPAAVRERLTQHLGDRAVALCGEQRLRLGASEENFANVGVNIPYQSGLARAIAASGPETIVSEGFFQWTPAALWVKARRGVPLVIAYEKTPYTERHAPRLRTLYRRWVARQTSAIACNGKLSKEYCTTVLGIPADRIVTGAMAADSASLASRSAMLSPADVAAARSRFVRDAGPLFLCVGRLIRLKGLRELLAGWQTYTSAGGCGSLVLVGDGPEREPIEQIITDLHLPRVFLAGQCDPDGVALHYATADALVMPTLEDNWSLVVPEAMACGKPILCSRFNGCWPELVHPNLNGWVFDPTDAGEIARALRQCETDEARLKRFGEASKRIVADFTPTRAAGAVLEACELALRSSGSRRVA
jgi:glycosyltransferase involved in cell wall biosynthesis